MISQFPRARNWRGAWKGAFGLESLVRLRSGYWLEVRSFKATEAEESGSKSLTACSLLVVTNCYSSSLPCELFYKAAQSQRSKERKRESMHPNQKPQVAFYYLVTKVVLPHAQNQAPPLKDRNIRDSLDIILKPWRRADWK